MLDPLFGLYVRIAVAITWPPVEMPADLLDDASDGDDDSTDDETPVPTTSPPNFSDLRPSKWL